MVSSCATEEKRAWQEADLRRSGGYRKAEVNIRFDCKALMDTQIYD